MKLSDIQGHAFGPVLHVTCKPKQIFEMDTHTLSILCKNFHYTFLWYVCTNFAHLETEICLFFLSQQLLHSQVLNTV